ncbi:hypothetical protein I6M49_22300 [Shewanella algae]|uniref:hypothetical protein n=1 Tax=Shewanella algae TaxID=38313 RepID=UPI001AAD2BEA|nr:hypothetical protein [Shewanella algae]MBO2656178.1 hypothetical protein [Shewanella algae]
MESISVLPERVTHWSGCSQKKQTIVYLDSGESVTLGCWPDEFQNAWEAALKDKD